mmetsp:Transcript_33743/g.71505  ORF Transcript_33743/g.71505 Transcript_33743/m.71505 type:complete len:208 (+) Transcript_33743:893-1516(+)
MPDSSWILFSRSRLVAVNSSISAFSCVKAASFWAQCSKDCVTFIRSCPTCCCASMCEELADCSCEAESACRACATFNFASSSATRALEPTRSRSASSCNSRACSTVVSSATVDWRTSSARSRSCLSRVVSASLSWSVTASCNAAFSCFSLSKSARVRCKSASMARDRRSMSCSSSDASRIWRSKSAISDWVLAACFWLAELADSASR